MTANKETLYWKTNPEWYYVSAETGKFELTDKAPERARISFDMWRNPKKYGLGR